VASSVARCKDRSRRTIDSSPSICLVMGSPATRPTQHAATHDPDLQTPPSNCSTNWATGDQVLAVVRICTVIRPCVFGFGVESVLSGGLITWIRSLSAVSGAPARRSCLRCAVFGWALRIQRLEGSRFARGGRYGTSIDFGLGVIERKSTCGAIFKSKFINLTIKPQVHDRLIVTPD
jgi:hypothetical protein